MIGVHIIHIGERVRDEMESRSISGKRFDGPDFRTGTWEVFQMIFDDTYMRDSLLERQSACQRAHDEISTWANKHAGVWKKDWWYDPINNDVFHIWYHFKPKAAALFKLSFT